MRHYAPAEYEKLNNIYLNATLQKEVIDASQPYGRLSGD